MFRGARPPQQTMEAGAHRESDMKYIGTHTLARPLAFQSGLAITLFASGLAGIPAALADDDGDGFQPGNLLVSRVVYDNNANNVQAGVTLLPPNCIGSAC